ITKVFFLLTGALKAQTAHRWADVFLKGDVEEFQGENRGGKHMAEFYDYFPDLEDAAREFTIRRCSEKAADFTAIDLANFIDKEYYLTTNTSKDSRSPLIRSIPSCRLDLIRWGARFKDNSQRPYFEGHERDDVKAHRQEFITYFLDRKDFYYTITDGEKPTWKLPTQSPPCILLFHDESTFKSGEVSAKRWFFGDEAPFHSKGRGRSNMGSDFIVQHESGPFFTLSPQEYQKAVVKYPQLEEDT
ncbi:unnamed protein product, partial [Adineta ricciae]